ncbi:unnamed protein product [Pedinophyceae sp. YPF-701]|nr:unnamed protein product [Pedinophyceae sp. YPF-701]
MAAPTSESIAQAHAATVRANAATIERLKKESNSLRGQIQDFALMAKQKAETEDDEAKIDSMEALYSELRRKYNQLLEQRSELTRELATSQNHAHVLQRQADAATAMLGAEGAVDPALREVRRLENSIGKMEMKRAEAEAIRATYEHIVRRLKQEATAFDNQLEALQATLRSMDREVRGQHLNQVRAQHGTEGARAELVALREQLIKETQGMEEQLATRQEKLDQLEAEVSRAQRKTQTMYERQKKNIEAPSKESKAAGVVSGLTGKVRMQAQRVVGELEEAFRRIKAATGVADPDEVIAKFQTQSATERQVRASIKQAEDDLMLLQDRAREVQAGLYDLKFARGGLKGGTKAMMEEFKVELMNAQQQLDHTRRGAETKAKIAVGMRAGLAYLAEMCNTVHMHPRVPIATDENLGQCLEAIQAKVKRMLQDCPRDSRAYGALLVSARDEARAREQLEQLNRGLNLDKLVGAQGRLAKGKAGVDDSGSDHWSLPEGSDSGFEEEEEGMEQARSAIKKRAAAVTAAVGAGVNVANVAGGRSSAYNG